MQREQTVDIDEHNGKCKKKKIEMCFAFEYSFQIVFEILKIFPI